MVEFFVLVGRRVRISLFDRSHIEGQLISFDSSLGLVEVLFDNGKKLALKIEEIKSVEPLKPEPVCDFCKQKRAVLSITSKGLLCKYCKERQLYA